MKKITRPKLETAWKKMIKKRDEYTCQLCGRTGEQGYQMHAHHIEAKQSIYSLTLPENGICLCALCHMSIHGQNGRTEQLKREELLTKKLGKEYLENLSIEIKSPPKFNTSAKEELYEQLLNKL